MNTSNRFQSAIRFSLFSMFALSAMTGCFPVRTDYYHIVYVRNNDDSFYTRSRYDPCGEFAFVGDLYRDSAESISIYFRLESDRYRPTTITIKRAELHRSDGQILPLIESPQQFKTPPDHIPDEDDPGHVKRYRVWGGTLAERMKLVPNDGETLRLEVVYRIEGQTDDCTYSYPFGISYERWRLITPLDFIIS